MDKNILISIFLQISKDMAYEAGLQINSFGVLDDPPDLVHDSFGFSYDDYNNGEFWSRVWEGNGADPAKVKGDFPVLFVEEGPTEISCIEETGYTVTWYIMVLDKILCETCPPEIVRTPLQVKANTWLMLRRWIAELVTYKYYQVDDNGDLSDQWLSAGRADYLESLPGVTVTDLGQNEFITDVQIDPVTIDEAGAWSEFKATRTKIEVYFCEDPGGSWNYKEPVIDKLAIIRRPC